MKLMLFGLAGRCGRRHVLSRSVPLSLSLSHMAPLNVQQFLQGMCQQVKDSFGNQGGSFDGHFDISNLLRNFEQASSEQAFHLHFPFPFSGLSCLRKRSKNTQRLDSGTLANSLVASANGNFESRNELIKQEHVFKNGEDVVVPFIHSPIPDGPSVQASSSFNVISEITKSEDRIGHQGGSPRRENQTNSSMELQILQKQLDNMDLASAPASKETLGRATWTFLHTLAAQFPEKPTRQQQRDVKELMAILSRLYPCRECADHFKEVIKANPVQAGSGVELAQWMCRVHNIVNRSLGKTMFPCQRVDARWGALDCDEGACSLEGRLH